LALPVVHHVRLAVVFGRIVVTCGLKKGELLDGPLFDGNVWELLPQRFGCLLCAQEGRDNKERRLAAESLGELSGLPAAKLSQRTGAVACSFATGIGHALTMTDQKNPRDRLR
jgi:hypothetical protein